MSENNAALHDALFAQLQQESFILLHTTDAESGGPTTSAISWVHAIHERKLRVAIDLRSRLVDNMKQHRSVAVTIFGTNTVTAVYGQASLIEEPLPAVPLKLACFDIDITSVRDAMFYGARLNAMPQYEKTYDKRAADKLDGQVFEAMRKA
ncbi:hypothetical protein [Paenibacillus sp. OSY-SE]|uniref:hypothetical protein n=1 Tax=Paenibacillus sp. OSY-SE TaxID=1196323 RepID=UPI0002E5D60E|nr:hypothetical protein [Paenibacillus sp. OSY-SE]